MPKSGLYYFILQFSPRKPTFMRENISKTIVQLCPRLLFSNSNYCIVYLPHKWIKSEDEIVSGASTMHIIPCNWSCTKGSGGLHELQFVVENFDCSKIDKLFEVIYYEKFWQYGYCFHWQLKMIAWTIWNDLYDDGYYCQRCHFLCYHDWLRV